jgi:hypothetical protein
LEHPLHTHHLNAWSTCSVRPSIVTEIQHSAEAIIIAGGHARGITFMNGRANRTLQLRNP